MAVANANAWVANGVTDVFWGANNSGVPYGSTGTISAGAGAGMPRLRGIQSLSIAEPDSPRVYVNGDNGVLTSFLNRATELPGGTMAKGVFDQTFYNWSKGSSVTELADWDLAPFLAECDNFQNISFIVNSPAQAMETANFAEAGYQTIFLFNSLVQSKVLTQIQSAQLQVYNDLITVNPAGKTLWNTTLASTIGGYVTMSPYPVHQHTFIGNASATTHTLTYTPAADDGDKVLVWVNGTLQTHTTNYSVNTSTKVLTFASAPASNAICTILYQYVPDC